MSSRGKAAQTWSGCEALRWTKNRSRKFSKVWALPRNPFAPRWRTVNDTEEFCTRPKNTSVGATAGVARAARGCSHRSSGRHGLSSHCESAVRRSADGMSRNPGGWTGESSARAAAPGRYDVLSQETARWPEAPRRWFTIQMRAVCPNGRSIRGGSMPAPSKKLVTQGTAATRTVLIGRIEKDPASFSIQAVSSSAARSCGKPDDPA